MPWVFLSAEFHTPKNMKSRLTVPGKTASKNVSLRVFPPSDQKNSERDVTRHHEKTRDLQQTEVARLSFVAIAPVEDNQKEHRNENIAKPGDK